MKQELQMMKMETGMKENIRMEKGMEKEYCFMQMETSMLDNL